MSTRVERETRPALAGPTTGQQSHHYLRLSLALIVLGLFITIGVYLVMSKGNWLPSISHYFYTPAHNVFVAALIAAAVALAALGGRDIETVFLDIAAVFAPLIALVPTGISAADLGSITHRMEPAIAHPCDDNSNCIPPQYLDSIANGVWSYILIVLIVVLVTIGIRAKVLKEVWNEGRRVREFFAAFSAPFVAILAVVGVWLLAFVAPANKGFPFNAPFGLSVHFAATILFFALFTAVPVVNAVRWIWARCHHERPTFKTRYAIVYIAVPVLMLADIGSLIGFVKAKSTGSEVLVCEAIALALFAAFWLAQTIQRWKETNPPYVWGALIAQQRRAAQ